MKLRLKFILKNLSFFNSKLNGQKLRFNTPLTSKILFGGGVIAQF